MVGVAIWSGVQRVLCSGFNSLLHPSISHSHLSSFLINGCLWVGWSWFPILSTASKWTFQCSAWYPGSSCSHPGVAGSTEMCFLSGWQVLQLCLQMLCVSTASLEQRGEHRVTLNCQLWVCGTHKRQGDNLGAASRLTNPSFCALLTFPVQLHFPWRRSDGVRLICSQGVAWEPQAPLLLCLKSTPKSWQRMLFQLPLLLLFSTHSLMFWNSRHWLFTSVCKKSWLTLWNYISI